ncbi:hypothetical protein T440DRAFT_502965 [Plenodomus tracheiphilus IPT5]|uniref:Uncharacterized protein n=1 Tax=Plenodomus tracheiphilus IPT5 TaxID=1408161 RepID=A0A6A7AQY6_9PLEO|nr:hypothetical protein T440DRAFT_502965 [Plenodomus tracheiphilus IPT5]
MPKVNTSQGILAIWYNRMLVPNCIKNDLDGYDALQEYKDEILDCAWQYTRCVIPSCSNVKRYIAFMRIIIIGTVAESWGELIDVSASDQILGYDLEGILHDLFAGTKYHAAMAREFRCFLFITAEKSSDRRASAFFQQYTKALTSSPKNWFRIRDADALARFTMAAALACNDFDEFWFNEAQLQVLSELAVCQYDAVAFHKHHAEAEVSVPTHRLGHGRGVDVFASRPDLTIGRPADHDLERRAKQREKLWYRPKERELFNPAQFEGFRLPRAELMFEGLAEMLRPGAGRDCPQCRPSSDPELGEGSRFGGTILCQQCQNQWRDYSACIVDRLKVFEGCLG